MKDGIKNYKIEKEISKNGSSKVYLATKLSNGEKYAIKKIDKSYLNDKRYKKYINNEIFILKNLDNEYTIKLHDLIIDLNYIYLVFEYCNGGDLEMCLKRQLELNKRAFSQEEVQHIMRQVISGFVYLHSREILHRDIKLENILVIFPTEEDKKNLNMLKSKIKITDFGFARYLKGENLAKSLLGSPNSMDPRILRKMARLDNDTEFGYDKKADIWSLGISTYELLIGCPAFEASSYEELLKKIEKGEYHIPHQVTLSIEAISFLNGMLQYNPNNRLDVFALSKQYFLTRNVANFHSIKLERANQGMNLSDSIILNAKEEKYNMDDIWGQFTYQNTKLNEIDPSQSQDERPFNENIATGKRIMKDVKDMIDIEMRIEDNNNRININNSSENEKNEKNKESSNVDPVISNYLHKQFDEVNKNCFYIEPLLIPIQPIDNNYNSPDPISKFMDAL
jgi:serine/threonine protein kinase